MSAPDGTQVEVSEKEIAAAKNEVAAAKAELAGAKERLVKAEDVLRKAQEMDPVDAQRVDEAKLGVAKAELGVAEAKLGVAEAKWQAAPEDEKAVFLAGVQTAQKSVETAQKIVETANKAYDKAVGAPTATPQQGAAGGAQAASGQGAIATPTDEMHILVKAKILECKSLCRIRAAVYLMAQRHCGRYNSSPERTICYSQNDLEIAVAFPECRRTDAERFLSSLGLWYLDSPLLGLRGKVIVERAMPVILIRESRMIMLEDYVAAESESPMESLADFKALPASGSSATSEVSVGNTLCSFQSLEKPECFGVANAYKMHLKDSAKFSDLRKKESNILVGSWTPCHQFLDGLNTADNMPQMAVGFLRECDDERVGTPPQKRSRIDVVIEFRSEAAEREMAGRFKDGSRRVEHLKWESFVHVEDKGTFMECLQWKYNDTKERWQSIDEM